MNGQGRELLTPSKSETAIVRLFDLLKDKKALKKLDLESPARNPFAKKGENQFRPMTENEQQNFYGGGDENHQTRAISDSKDPDKKTVGYAYWARTDDDDMLREPFVQKMAGLKDDTIIFDFNVDAPGRKDYVPLVTSAAKQSLQEIFKKNPDAGVVFYVGDADLVGPEIDREDYDIMLSLGARDIGRLSYDNPGDPGTAEEPNDHVLFVDKARFEAATAEMSKKTVSTKTGESGAFEKLKERASRGAKSHQQLVTELNRDRRIFTGRAKARKLPPPLH